MSLVFTKKSLINAAEKAIKNREGEINEWQKKIDTFRVEHARTWNDKNRERLVTLRNVLTRELKLTGPVTMAAINKDVPNVGYLSDLFYFGPGDYELNQKAGHKPNESVIATYQGLIELMQAHTGDTISANQLKVLGYTNLTALFNDAVRAGGEVKTKSTSR